MAGPPFDAVAILGPTASGKTELAVALARRLGSEVVSVDSRQVYRRLDAGTAKPRRDAQGRVDGVPYHLVDCADPRQRFDAGRFAELARPLCHALIARGLRPVLAGGTGLYLRALTEGLSPLPRRDDAVRSRLTALAEASGRARLHERLKEVDPESALRIPPNNLQRVVRALEIFELSGRPASELLRAAPRAPTGLRARLLWIRWPDATLKERIENRAEALWPGLLDEVRRLVGPEEGYDGSEPGFQSLGYREALRCVRGDLSSGDGLAALKRTTWAYARRQRTWLRHQAPEARALEGGPLDRLLKEALDVLELP